MACIIKSILFLTHVNLQQISNWQLFVEQHSFQSEPKLKIPVN